MAGKTATVRSVAPDFTYWGKMAGWTIEEATALLLKRNPDLLGDPSAWSKSDPEYYLLWRRLDRARVMDLIWSPITPRDFIEWALSNELDPSQELQDCARNNKPIRNWRAKYFRMKRRRNRLKALDADLNQVGRRSLLKIIAAYARQLKRSEAPRETVSRVKSGVQLVGLSIDRKTIQKCLTEAEELVRESANGNPI